MERTNGQRSGDVVLRAYTALPHSTFNNLSIGLHTPRGILSPPISSSFFVIPSRRSPSVCRPRAPSTTFLSSSHATLLPHPAISKRKCSSAFSTSSGSRLCPALRRALTWIHVAWAWKLFTRAYKGRIIPYVSDGKLSLRYSAAFSDRPFRPPCRISFRPTRAARPGQPPPLGYLQANGLFCVDENCVPMYDTLLRWPRRALS